VSPANKPSIPIRSVEDPPEELYGALEAAGALVVTGALDDSALDRVQSELAPHVDTAPLGEDDPAAFYPAKTRRVTALVARSEQVGEIVMHPTSKEICDRHLLPNCERYHLHVTAVLQVGPGARSQILHREEDPFSFFELPRPNLLFSTMWAITDFTADNGGTLVVPGSHRWEADRKAQPHEIVSAEMPAGSVMYWLGGTLHGAGANVTEEWRYGVILSYALGWLRQEENMYQDVPPHIAKRLSPELLERIGHVMHGGLGLADPRVLTES